MNVEHIESMLLVEARWKTPFCEDVWASLKDCGEFHENEPIPWVNLGPAFLDADRPLSERFADASCGWDRKAEQLQWMLRRIPPPEGDPGSVSLPESLVTLSTKLGGLAGLERLLRKAIEDIPAPIASFVVQVVLRQSDGWNCRLLHKRLTDPITKIDELGSTACVEQTGIRFENGTNGLDEFTVVYAHERGLYRLRILARSRLDFGRSLDLPFGRELAELVISRAFVRDQKKETEI